MNTQNVISTNEIISGLPPLVTQARWAALIGLSPGAVEAAVSRRIWPFVKIGRHKFINVEAIRIAAAKKADDFVLQ